MKKTTNQEKHILITNLTYVQIGNVRPHCNALLLSHSRDFLGDGMRCTARGFGPDPVWETFDMLLPSIEHEAESVVSRHMFVGDDDKMKPLASGSRLKFADGGPEMVLWTNDDTRPIDVETFVGTREEGTILRVWAVLPLKVEQYWNAPYMPRVGQRVSLRGMTRGY